MGGEPEVIVAAERDIFAPAHADPCALRRFEHAPLPPQPLGLELCELGRKRLLE
jgi:hypothetical protein